MSPVNSITYEFHRKALCSTTNLNDFLNCHLCYETRFHKNITQATEINAHETKKYQENHMWIVIKVAIREKIALQIANTAFITWLATVRV